jgi:hypothetical protein
VGEKGGAMPWGREVCYYILIGYTLMVASSDGGTHRKFVGCSQERPRHQGPMSGLQGWQKPLESPYEEV